MLLWRNGLRSSLRSCTLVGWRFESSREYQKENTLYSYERQTVENTVTVLVPEPRYKITIRDYVAININYANPSMVDVDLTEEQLRKLYAEIGRRLIEDMK
jgi:hypothetical protein